MTEQDPKRRFNLETYLKLAGSSMGTTVFSYLGLNNLITRNAIISEQLSRLNEINPETVREALARTNEMMQYDGAVGVLSVIATGFLGAYTLYQAIRTRD